MGGWVSVDNAKPTIFLFRLWINAFFISGFSHVKKSEGSKKITCQMDENFALKHVGCPANDEE